VNGADAIALIFPVEIKVMALPPAFFRRLLASWYV
jgi:hypothetical protein